MKTIANRSRIVHKLQSPELQTSTVNVPSVAILPKTTNTGQYGNELVINGHHPNDDKLVAGLYSSGHPGVITANNKTSIILQPPADASLVAGQPILLGQV